MRFGVSTRDITPSFPTAMHGYGMRHDAYDGVNDPVTFTALVLEEGDRRAVLGAADLCTFANDGTTPELLARVGEKVGCAGDNVMLCASHTHGGPKMPSSSATMENVRYLDATRQYSAWLADQAVAAAEEAASNMREGSLWFGEGKTSLPMNRRPDRDGDVPNAPNPGGPVDDRLQLLVVRDEVGDIASVGMRLSCHPVTTGAQHKITADFPGAWRAEFARAFGPDVTPFFLQGAGADARPRFAENGDCWRAVPHSELPDIGAELLQETLRVLTRGDLEPIGDLVLDGKINAVQAPCEKRHTTEDDFQKLLSSEDHYTRSYAEEGLRRLKAGDPYPDHVTYHVHTLWLNDGTALIGLDGEPLCGLGAFVESSVAPRRGMVLGYVDACLSYMPDTRELERGGYEAESYIYDNWTGPWKSGLEQTLADGVMKCKG